jgi:hypothetical protein
MFFEIKLQGQLSNQHAFWTLDADDNFKNTFLTSVKKHILTFKV